jgi:hypothetical protein
MARTWTIDELRDALREFEVALQDAGLADNSVRTYVDRSERFLRWLTGDYIPGTRGRRRG